MQLKAGDKVTCKKDTTVIPQGTEGEITFLNDKSSEIEILWDMGDRQIATRCSYGMADILLEKKG